MARYRDFSAQSHFSIDLALLPRLTLLTPCDAGRRARAAPMRSPAAVIDMIFAQDAPDAEHDAGHAAVLL